MISGSLSRGKMIAVTFTQPGATIAHETVATAVSVHIQSLIAPYSPTSRTPCQGIIAKPFVAERDLSESGVGLAA